MDPIAAGLPHRPPFIFLDEVVALVPGQSAVCRKHFTVSEPFFAGHFPGHPLVPGVLLAEAAAQTAGIAAGEPGRVYHLSAIRQMKFIAPVPPDTVVDFTATKTGQMERLRQFAVTARVGDAIVAEGVIILNEA